MRTNRILMLFVCISVLVSLLTACGNVNPNNEFQVSFYRKVAREVQEDGWVFTFVRNGYKDQSRDDSTQIKYQFYGINQRYRYNDDYIRTEVNTTPNGYSQSVTVIPACLTWGVGSEAERRDMQLIQSIINDPTATDESLLALDPDDFSFEVINKEMFFRLMQTALTSDPQQEGSDQTYWDKPTYAFLTEPAYVDGYKFQVCFMQETGCVDELYIDVLYQTGTGYKDYVQLSDLIDEGSANEDQLRAFALIQDICDEIKDTEYFRISRDEYYDVVFDNISFARLYTFLENIHNNDYEQYVGEPILEVNESDDFE